MVRRVTHQSLIFKIRGLFKSPPVPYEVLFQSRLRELSVPALRKSV